MNMFTGFNLLLQCTILRYSVLSFVVIFKTYVIVSCNNVQISVTVFNPILQFSDFSYSVQTSVTAYRHIVFKLLFQCFDFFWRVLVFCHVLQCSDVCYSVLTSVTVFRLVIVLCLL